MTLVYMEREGQADIAVDSSVASAHEAIGWRRKKIAVSADGQTLTIPNGTVLNVTAAGALELDGVQVLSSASEINELNVNQDIVTTVHYGFTPAADSATAVMAATNLGAAVQHKVSGLTSPDVPRTVTIKGNVSGITGNVKVIGTNINNEPIDDTIALNGTGEIEGIKAFKTVTQVDLPAQVHTPVAQVETATVVGAIINPGNASVVVTAAGMAGTPKTIAVAVLALDDASAVATKIKAALNADTAVKALYNVGGTGANVSLTRKVPAANDDTLNIATDNGSCSGLTTEAASADTTAGVVTDSVSVGIAKHFGLPHIVTNAALLQEKFFGGSTDNGTLAVDADEVEKNLFALDGTPDGETAVDLYYLA